MTEKKYIKINIKELIPCPIHKSLYEEEPLRMELVKGIQIEGLRDQSKSMRIM
jgi:Cu2+-containing amine oxidase